MLCVVIFNENVKYQFCPTVVWTENLFAESSWAGLISAFLLSLIIAWNQPAKVDSWCAYTLPSSSTEGKHSEVLLHLIVNLKKTYQIRRNHWKQVLLSPYQPQWLAHEVSNKPPVFTTIAVLIHLASCPRWLPFLWAPKVHFPSSQQSPTVLVSLSAQVSIHSWSCSLQQLIDPTHISCWHPCLPLDQNVCHGFYSWTCYCLSQTTERKQLMHITIVVLVCVTMWCVKRLHWNIPPEDALKQGLEYQIQHAFTKIRLRRTVAVSEQLTWTETDIIRRKHRGVLHNINSQHSFYWRSSNGCNSLFRRDSPICVKLFCQTYPSISQQQRRRWRDSPF